MQGGRVTGYSQESGETKGHGLCGKISANPTNLGRIMQKIFNIRENSFRFA
jgi:hypothetical protein